MSGYRTLHRAKETDFPLNTQSPSPSPEEEASTATTSTTTTTTCQPTWAVSFSPCRQSHKTNPGTSRSRETPPPLRAITSSSDGLLRAYTLTDSGVGRSSSSAGGSDLDGTAVAMTLTHVLVPSCGDGGDGDATEEEEEDDGGVGGGEMALGSAAIAIVRNYVGEDESAGGEVVASLRLDGRVSVWTRDAQPLHASQQRHGNDEHDGGGGQPVRVFPKHQFDLPDAAGTTLALLSPQLTGYSPNGGGGGGGTGVVCAWVGCLDGSTVLVSTGVPVANPSAATAAAPPSSSRKPPPPSGTILDRVGAGSALPTAIAIRPIAGSRRTVFFSVGRKDGTVDLYSRCPAEYHRGGGGGGTTRRTHRLTHHAGEPVRAVAYVPDGSLLLTGSDSGDIAVHDVSSCDGDGGGGDGVAVSVVRMVSWIRGAHRGRYVLGFGIMPSSCVRFLSCGGDGVVRVWDVVESKDGGSAVHTFDTGAAAAAAAADGEGRDAAAVVWDVACSGGKAISCGDDGRLQIYACED